MTGRLREKGIYSEQAPRVGKQKGGRTGSGSGRDWVYRFSPQIVLQSKCPSTSKWYPERLVGIEIPPFPTNSKEWSKGLLLYLFVFLFVVVRRFFVFNWVKVRR